MDPLHDFMTGLPTVTQGYKTMNRNLMVMVGLMVATFVLIEVFT